DFLAGSCDANDDRLPPAAMRAFQRLPHDLHIADAFEAVVRTTFGQVDQIGHQIALHVGWIDEMRHPEFFCDGAAIGIEIHAHDHFCADKTQARYHVEANSAEAKHDAACSGFYLGGVHHRADTGGDAASDVADLLERRVLADLRHRDLRQH